MNLREDIHPITHLKQQTARLLAEVGKTRRPIVITQSGKATAVVMDIQSYERNRKALLLLKLLQMSEAEIRQRKVKSQEEVFRGIEELFSSGRQ